MSGRGRRLDIDSAGAQHGDELAGRQARSFRQQYALAAHGGMLANGAPLHGRKEACDRAVPPGRRPGRGASVGVSRAGPGASS